MNIKRLDGVTEYVLDQAIEEYTTLTSPFTDIIRELEQQLEGGTR